MTIIERILELLKTKKISQITFSEKTAISAKTFSTWKTRNTNPPADLLPSIADALEVSIDYLVLGKEKENVLLPEEHDLVNNYRKLDSRGKHKIHTTIYEELDRMAAMDAEEQRNLNEIFKLASSPNIPNKQTDATLDINTLFSQPTKKG